MLKKSKNAKMLTILTSGRKEKYTSSVMRPTLLYIWRSSPKYAPPERSR